MLTKRLSGVEVRATELHGCEVEWHMGSKGWEMKERSGTDFSMKVDLVLLAMGFVHVVHHGLIEQLGLKLDAFGNVTVDNYATSEESVLATKHSGRCGATERDPRSRPDCSGYPINGRRCRNRPAYSPGTHRQKCE